MAVKEDTEGLPGYDTAAHRNSRGHRGALAGRMYGRQGHTGGFAGLGAHRKAAAAGPDTTQRAAGARQSSTQRGCRMHTDWLQDHILRQKSTHSLSYANISIIILPHNK